MTTIEATHGADSSPAMHANRRWFVALGIALLIAGFVASLNLLAASLASVVYIAAMMLAGAAMRLVHAFSAEGWKKRTLDIASAVFYGIASAVLVWDPVLSAIDISLVIGVLMIAAGAGKIVSGIQMRANGGWGWIVASGVATAAVGGIVLATWPAVGLWLLGAALTVDLVIQGWSYLAFGLSIRDK